MKILHQLKCAFKKGDCTCEPYYMDKGKRIKDIGNIVLCVKKETEYDFYRVTGSVTTKCFRCECTLWLSFRGQNLFEAKNNSFCICLDCASFEGIINRARIPPEVNSEGKKNS